MVSLYLQLPLHLQWNVLFHWLPDRKYIANVDAAACNHSLRVNFHHMLRSNVIRVPMPTFYNDFFFVDWCVNRMLAMENAKLASHFPEHAEVRRNFLEMTGGYITNLHICNPEDPLNMTQLFVHTALYCTNLTELHLENIDAADALIAVFAQCKNMLTFRCQEIKQTTLEALVHFCPNLQSLEYAKVIVDDSTGLKVMNTSNLLLRSLTNLKALVLPGTRWSEPDMYVLAAHCAQLTELQLGYIKPYCLTALIEGCTQMEIFSTQAQEDGSGTYDRACGLMVKHWRHLRSLVLFNTAPKAGNVITDDNILAFVNGCPRLERLQVGGMNAAQWSGSPLDIIATPGTAGDRALKALQVFVLPPAKLRALLAACPRIEYLSIDVLAKWSYERQQAFTIVQQSSVKRIRLGTHVLLNCRELEALMGLEELHFQLSAHTTSAALVSFAKHSPQLHTLVVHMNSALLVNKLQHVLPYCPQFRVLIVQTSDTSEALFNSAHKEFLCGCLKQICAKLVTIELPYAKKTALSVPPIE